METCGTSDNAGEFGTWRIAGMDELIAAVRGAGARNVVMAGGLQHANDLSQWLADEPMDPAGQLAASFHVYDFKACNSQSCWHSTVARVTARVPVVTGEIGESDGTANLVNQYLPWADARVVSYVGWTWDT